MTADTRTLGPLRIGLGTTSSLSSAAYTSEAPGPVSEIVASRPVVHPSRVRSVATVPWTGRHERNCWFRLGSRLAFPGRQHTYRPSSSSGGGLEAIPRPVAAPTKAPTTAPAAAPIHPPAAATAAAPNRAPIAPPRRFGRSRDFKLKRCRRAKVTTCAWSRLLAAPAPIPPMALPTRCRHHLVIKSSIAISPRAERKAQDACGQDGRPPVGAAHGRAARHGCNRADPLSANRFQHPS
jgi:hypothetical protein